MLAIRLQRNGRKAYPVYRVVVQEANRHPLSGRVIAYLGSYNPHTKDVVLDKASAEKYLNNGAQPSSRAALLFKKQGIKLPKWVKEPAKKQRAVKNADKLRKNRPAEPEAPAEEPVVEAPAEEAAAAEEVKPDEKTTSEEKTDS
jgi:small subunit ribosomal protein S16